MKIFLAGAENSSASKVLQWAKTPNVLMSYYYLRNRKFEDIEKMIMDYKANGNEMIMLDSGAHTFFTQAGLESAVSGSESRTAQLKVDPETYLQEYAHWLETNGQYFDIVVELDIGKIVGMEKVYEWRKILKGVVGDKLMVVHHPDYMNNAEFEEMCRDYKYTAVGAGHRNELGEWNAFADIGKKYGTKIHGLAMTKCEFMERIPLFSVDSTSWKMGSKYGQSYYFNGRTLQLISKEERRRYRNAFEADGLDFDKLIADDNEEVDKFNALQWKKYEANLNGTPITYTGKAVDPEEKKAEEVDSEMPIEQVKKPYDPTVNLPAHTKGKIMEIRKDPAIEEKRKQALKANLNNFKTGLYAKKLPLYCNDCYAKSKCKFYQEPQEEGQQILCALHEDYTKWFSPTDFDIRDENIVNKSRNNIIDKMMHRLGIQLYFEMLDGGIQDKSATTLAMAILDRLAPKMPLFQQTNNTQININREVADLISQIDEPLREKIIGLLETKFGEQDKPDGGQVAS